MATMWRRAMHYLGLGPDDEYEDDLSYSGAADVGPPRTQGDAAPAPPPRAAVTRTVHPPGVPQGPATGAGPAAQRPAGPPDLSRQRVATTPPPNAEGAAVRRLTPKGGHGAAAAGAAVAGGGAGGDEGSSFGVRQVATTVRPHAVTPTTFNEAQEVGDRFKADQPVILNLQGVDKELARRLIDFSSGLCYGLGGQMEKVATNVYLITPTDVEVSEEERQKLQQHGLHDG